MSASANENFEIRRFHDDEEEMLISLWLGLVQDEEGSDLNILPSEENAGRWLKFVKDVVSGGRGDLLVATGDGALCGYIFYSWDSSPLRTVKKVGMIYDLYVVPECRGRGAGTALLGHALEELKTHGAQLVRLSVMSNNSRAISLYSRFGFVEQLKTMELRLQN